MNSNNLPKVTVAYRSPTNISNSVENYSDFNQGLSNSVKNSNEPLRNIRGTRFSSLGARNGWFLKPKHLILTEFGMLKPASKVPPSIPVFNLHETLPKNILRQHFDEVEIPDIDLYNFNDVTLASNLNIRNVFRIY